MCVSSPMLTGELLYYVLLDYYGVSNWQ